MDSGRRGGGRSFLSRLLWCLGREKSRESSLAESDSFEYAVEDRAVYGMPRQENRREEVEVLLGREIFQKRRVYEYVRKKTYSTMNQYEYNISYRLRMSPNDFLNHISSVFVENLKEPVPKDPLCRPRVYNSRYRLKNPMPRERRPAVYRTHLRGVDSAFSYKDAIEDDQPFPQTQEKVLIWKIVVANKEDKQK